MLTLTERILDASTESKESMEDYEIPFAWITKVAMIRAENKDIILTTSPFNRVFRTSLAGHYFHLLWSEGKPAAQITAVDSYISKPGTYDNLLPGFLMDSVEELEVPEEPSEEGRYISINYKFDTKLFVKEAIEIGPT
jgi:hypothetical protein